MDHNKATEEILKLQKLIRHHNSLYYVENEPSISDEEYENMKTKISDEGKE